MQRDPHLVHSILLAIQAKTSRTAAPIAVPGVDRQTLLDHLASMHEEGLYIGPKPHRSSATGQVDQALVRDFTPAGRTLLDELDGASEDEPGAVEFGPGGEDEPRPEGPSSTWDESKWDETKRDEATGARQQLVGVQGGGVAGEISASIQNDVPPDGVVVAGPAATDDERYGELMSRVALLEDSLGQLRTELALSRPVGLGHNRPPGPVPIEDLQWADELTAILKDRGPAPPDDPEPLLQEYEKAADLAKRIQWGLVTIGKEMAKGAAREVGKEMLTAQWAAVSYWIIEVGKSLLSWLGL